MPSSPTSTLCCILTAENNNELFKKIGLAFNVELNKATVHESPVGPTYYVPLFEGQTSSGSIKLIGFINAYLPKELDLYFTGTEEQRRLFCTVIDAWDGTVIQRHQWLS